jgi:hypothetical protein
MNDLIKALQILSKYLQEDEHNPTHCEHDELYVTCINPVYVSAEDTYELEKLGFYADEYGFKSSRFGSS